MYDNIKPFDATDIVQSAIDVYREFWDEYWKNHSYKQECSFQGKRDDLDMLDFCRYELGQPRADNYKLASIIWGNVIVNNSSLSWGCDDNDTIYLYDAKDDSYGFYINLYQYVTWMTDSNKNSSEVNIFGYLTQKLILDMVYHKYHLEGLQQLKSLLLVENGYDNGYEVESGYATDMLSFIFDMYSGNPKKLQKFKEDIEEDFFNK